MANPTVCEPYACAVSLHTPNPFDMAHLGTRRNVGAVALRQACDAVLRSPYAPVPSLDFERAFHFAPSSWCEDMTPLVLDKKDMLEIGDGVAIASATCVHDAIEEWMQAMSCGPAVPRQ